MKHLLILICLINSSGLTLAGQHADRLKAQQEAWKKSIASELRKNYDQAITDLKDYTSNNGDKYNAALRLGWLYYSKKDYAGAVKYYQLAAKNSQGAVTPLLGLMNSYRAAKQTKEAVRACKSVLVLDKTNYTATMTLAGMLYDAKDYRNSGLQYAKINKLYPEDLGAMSGLGWCLFYDCLLYTSPSPRDRG